MPLAESGDSKAELLVARMFFYGHGAKQDVFYAMQWLENSI